DKYEELLKNREEMRLRGQVETERSAFSFRVIDPPTLPRTPEAPNRPLLLIGVLIAGLAAGAGAAFVVGQLRSGYPTAEKLERSLGLPVAGTISRSITATRRSFERKLFRQFIGASAALGGVCVLLLAVEFIQIGSVA
ncbi:MAG: XrtA system polysaccharide chain length determinant, partial [Qipengyuania sp.]